LRHAGGRCAGLGQEVFGASRGVRPAELPVKPATTPLDDDPPTARITGWGKLAKSWRLLVNRAIRRPAHESKEGGFWIRRNRNRHQHKRNTEHRRAGLAR